MKKYKVWVIILLILFLLPTIANAAELGSRSLSVGSRGDDVRELQELLSSLGYFNVSPTGYFGEVTKTSVINFQKASGISANGNATLLTIHKLKYENGVAADSFVYARLLKLGVSGGDVMNLQEVLRHLGYFPATQEATGYYGKITESAAKAFQKDANISVDGMVGPATANALNKALGKTDSSNNSEVIYYTIQKGDTLWDLARKYKTTVSKIEELNSLSSSVIYVGQKIKIPSASVPEKPIDKGNDAPRVTYNNYTVEAGDTLWGISRKFGLLETDLYEANGFSSKTVLYIGQVIKIPVYNIPVKPTPGPQYGELLDWWTEAKYVVPFNSTFTVTDFYTGISFQAVRTYGANHADCEPLTANDTKKILNLWDKYHTSYWSSRPVIITINGRRLAASMSAMFHAGVDAHPDGAYVLNRSGGYGAGTNFDAIKGNKADGHFDIHFLNSTTHATGVVNANHQKNVIIAAGK